MNKPTNHSLIELLKLYSDGDMVQLINFAKLYNGSESSSVTIPYEDSLYEMEKRDVDCSHVRDYNRNLNEMIIELRDINGKKRLFANWMVTFTDEDYSIISIVAVESEAAQHEIIDESEFGVFCPICDEFCKCGHMIAIYDDSYQCFEGGDVYESIGEFEEIIHIGFRQLLNKGVKNPLFTLRSLKDCWDDFQSRDPEPDDEMIGLDRTLTNKVIIDLLRYHGADWGTNEIANSGPGISSSESFLFANDTLKVIKDGLGRLRKEFIF